MNSKNTDNILPELFIQMHFEEMPKKSKSTVNSPSTMANTPSAFMKTRGCARDEFPLPAVPKSAVEPADSDSSKLKGFEDLGLFSEFKFMNNLTKTDLSEPQRRRTIHITDFMNNETKMSLLRGAGVWEAYIMKKQEFQKETLMRDSNVQKFFNHKEKEPEYFQTPQISQRYLSRTNNCKKEAALISNKRTQDIDQIIEKCDAAMYLKPPTVLTKSISPRIEKSASDKVLPRRRINIKS